MSLVVGIWGDDKTGKSSVALTFPKPMQYMEFDLGGYDRAKWRFDCSGIAYKAYTVPLQGSVMGATVRPSKIITGVEELWYEFLQDYIAFLSNKEMVTGVFDTGTLLWEIICSAYLQEKQELQLNAKGENTSGKELRVSLLPIEYREPNIRMRGLIYHARARGKILVIPHHSRDEYRPMPNPRTGLIEDAKTGRKERSGFGSLGDSTDWMLHTFKKGKEFRCRTEVGTVPDALMDMEFNEPSYEAIVNASNMIMGVV